MVAIICEFNPFHNGHRYIIETAKRLTNEPVLAVMSGSFCQRGEVAVCSKFERAAAALRYGADIVAELPAVHAVSCAQRFAQAGVHIATAFESTSCLAFGCEDDNLPVLQAAADAFQNEAVNRKIALLMKGGAYYPQAAEHAVREVCGDAAADMLTQPNSVLAVEYLRALGGSSVKPLPVRRVGTAHDSRESCGGYLSASAIRERLRRGEDVSAFMPEPPADITYPALLERAVLCRLRTMTAADFRALPEVGEGLENRLTAAVKTCHSVEDIITAVKTKRYTHARLRRILCCALLGVTESLQAQRADYVRVLGFSQTGAALLKTCRLPVVTSAAKAMKADSTTAEFLRRDILATDIAALAYQAVKPCGADYHTKLIRSWQPAAPDER